jgi:peptide chain release factor 1
VSAPAIDPRILKKLQDAESRFEAVDQKLADPHVLKDPEKIRVLGQERSDLEALVQRGGQLRRVSRELEGARELVDSVEDPDMRELAEVEVEDLEARLETLTAEVRELLIPRDPMEDRAAVVEIRAGTGGDEAGLFAHDLWRMYERLAERNGWKMDVLSISEGIPGAVKEVIFEVRGRGAFGKLRYESGVHRVQRVPATESQGRIHTSAATVAVLPEAEEVDLQIDPSELRIDVFRSSGPGGQSVNTTDSAVRITHVPSGLVVSCQDEKSQHKNKAKALKVLRSRLLDRMIAEQEAERAATRKSQVGTGDRSQKIRTYNFPQNRVTDHRIGLTVYNLDGVLQGDLDEFVSALRLARDEERMEGSDGAGGPGQG